MTSSACSDCGRECVVGIQSALKIGSRWILWRECPGCLAKREREQLAIIERRKEASS